jgi:hypothetical protein
VIQQPEGNRLEKCRDKFTRVPHFCGRVALKIFNAAILRYNGCFYMISANVNAQKVFHNKKKRKNTAGRQKQPSKKNES